jgi:hypothetical protein
MFDNIRILRPYFFSLREIENNVSLDIKLPVTWKFENIVSPYKSIKVKVQDKNEKFTLISLVSSATADGYEVVFRCAREVISVNKEYEEKQRLLQSKIKELEILFQHESLDKLREISFIENAKQQEDTTSIRMVEQGDSEGLEGSGEPQEPDDSGNQKIG